MKKAYKEKLEKVGKEEFDEYVYCMMCGFFLKYPSIDKKFWAWVDKEGGK